MNFSVSMKSIGLFLCTLALAGAAEPPKTDSNTVVLDAAGVQNLRIETAEAEESDFEESVFSLGRIEAIPASRSGISSRVPGRLLELKVSIGDAVEAGQEVGRLEARVAGNPPPILPLVAAAKGAVTKVNVAVGEPLDPEASLLEITDLSEVFAIARVPEHIAGRMKPGTTAHIRVTALPEEKLEGELLRFGTEADRESGTLDALFKLPNPHLTLRPGMRAEFSVVLSKRESVLAVPRSAVQGDGGNRFVYVKDLRLPNAFVKSPVTLGESNDRFVEITSGVLVGDDVVVRGAYSLSFASGSSVSLKEALDAAHGHEHAEDGSELTPEKRAAIEAKKAAASGHPLPAAAQASPWWKYSTFALAALLVVSLIPKKRPPAADDDAPASKVPEKEGA